VSESVTVRAQGQQVFRPVLAAVRAKGEVVQLELAPRPAVLASPSIALEDLAAQSTFLVSYLLI
jgi:hypothetical protein